MPDAHGCCTVLIVDVDSSRLERLERHARAAGLQVSTASCFSTARQQIRHSAPDILVSALPLAAYNGLHLAVIANHHHPDCAAVIFSEGRWSGSDSEVESVRVRMVHADRLFQRQFWRQLSTMRDEDAALTPDTLRAIA